METYSISEFKAQCPRILREVRRTRQEVRVTVRGKPVARILPAGDEDDEALASLRGTVLGWDDDVVSFSAEERWEGLSGAAP
jgi:prevent-host-death family protein